MAISLIDLIQLLERKNPDKFDQVYGTSFELKFDFDLHLSWVAIRFTYFTYILEFYVNVLESSWVLHNVPT